MWVNDKLNCFNLLTLLTTIGSPKDMTVADYMVVAVLPASEMAYDMVVAVLLASEVADDMVVAVLPASEVVVSNALARQFSFKRFCIIIIFYYY